MYASCCERDVTIGNCGHAQCVGQRSYGQCAADRYSAARSAGRALAVVAARSTLSINDLVVAAHGKGTTTSGAANTDFERELKKHRGVQVISDFIPAGAQGAFAWSYGGGFQSALADKSPLGLVFKKTNPLFEILAHLPETLITFAASGGGPLADLALAASAAAARYAKGLNWATGGDPLVIDLGGDGIAAGRAATGVYFNIDGGVFAKRTGWVAGHDALLAMDRNGNGTIDDVTELFGSRTQGGFAALAALDSNADGRIDARDAAFGAVRVWQDANQDGVSQAGELTTLAARGIVTLGLTATPLDGAVTAEGTRLLAANDDILYRKAA